MSDTKKPQATKNFMAAINLTFWLDINARDERQAQRIVSAIHKLICTYIENEHGRGQGEMLKSIQSGIYECTRGEAWNTLEELDMRHNSNDDDPLAAYSIALAIASGQVAEDFLYNAPSSILNH